MEKWYISYQKNNQPPQIIKVFGNKNEANIFAYQTYAEYTADKELISYGGDSNYKFEWTVREIYKYKSGKEIPFRNNYRIEVMYIVVKTKKK